MIVGLCLFILSTLVTLLIIGYASLEAKVERLQSKARKNDKEY